MRQPGTMATDMSGTTYKNTDTQTPRSPPHTPHSTNGIIICPFSPSPIAAVAFSPGSGHHHKSITAKWQLPVCLSIHSQATPHSGAKAEKPQSCNISFRA